MAPFCCAVMAGYAVVLLRCVATLVCCVVMFCLAGVLRYVFAFVLMRRVVCCLVCLLCCVMRLGCFVVVFVALC